MSPSDSEQAFETTRTVEPRSSLEPLRLLVPGLVILSHPEQQRVGEEVALTGLASGERAEVSRSTPAFAAPGREEAFRSLDDPYLSRRPVCLSAGPEPGSVTLDRGGSRTPVSVGGEEITERRTFSAAEVERGVVLVLSRRIALLLHPVDPVPVPVPAFGLVGESTALLHLRQEIRAAAGLDAPVLLRGETGTGKELVARALHDAGRRRQAPYHAVNLGALVPALAASELFGAVRGAYTGADRGKKGFFPAAAGGTLFLDEIGEAPPEVQVMLLRTLETGEVQPVGSVESFAADVRVIAATDADLETAVREGRFRPALLHRLAGYEIRVPPLRERRDDIARLLRHFFTVEAPWPSAEVIARLVEYDWPGNVRQLRNVARRLFAAGTDAQERLLADLLPETGAPAPAPPVLAEPKIAAPPPQRFRRPSEVGDEELAAVLEAHNWQLKTAARALGLSRGTLYRRIEAAKLRKAAEIEPPEIEAALARHGGDTGAAARDLKVSPQGLKRRITALAGLQRDRALRRRGAPPGEP